MNTSVVAGLRFPLGLACGLLLTGSLFTALQALTQRQFEVMETVTIRPEWTRVKREETLETKRPDKVVREELPPAVDVILPPVVGTETEIVATLTKVPTTILPTGGIPLSGADQEAMPVFRVNPVYPPNAAARDIEGWVEVQFNINAAGAVTDVVVVDSEPARIFDEATLTAVSRWRYNPSVVNGTAVERRGMRTILRFNLEDE
jgi:periplasmic protein TonB